MRRLPLLIVVALLGATLPAAPPATAAGAPTGEKYVALGDSYAAGLGITPADTSTNAAACGRSAANYPHLLAKRLGLALTDVTCSGAVIADLERFQTVRSGSVPPQLDALTSDTRLVTLTIGGNDLGFGEIAGFCASLSGPDGPVQGDNEADCRSHYDDGTDTLAAKLTDTIGPALTAAVAAVKARAPQAQVLFVDYPAIVPDAANVPAAGCWGSPLQQSDALPFTSADLPYLQQTQQRLDQLLSETAGTTTSSNATVYADSLAHTACSSSPWVNGVRLDGFSVAPSSLHPNATGARTMADAAASIAVGLLSGGAPSTSPVGAPAGSGVPGWVWVVVGVAVVLLLVVGLGVFRVVRRRR